MKQHNLLSDQKLRILGVLLSVTSLFFLLVACQSSTTNHGQQMKELIKVSDLAVPEDTTLVTQKDGVDQGSDEICQSLYVERLYGTQQPFESIRLFYEQMLVADGWQKDTDFSDATYVVFERTDGFRLGINDHETASRISRRQIEEARQKYTTVYLVSAVYATPKTWEQCGQRVEDSK